MGKTGTFLEKNLGIWVDHKEAVLVWLKGDKDLVERIESNVESNFRPSGGAKASGSSVAQSIIKEQKADERRYHQLNDFYQRVIKKIDKADKLFVFGPGQAKLELVKEIEKIKVRKDRIEAVEPSDRLTENQIVAKVRSFFSMSKNRRLP